MLSQCLLVLGAGLLAYLVQRWIVLRRSPLNKLPGPWSAKWSNFSHSRRYLSGYEPYEMIKMHEKYGPVVRTAPNEVSFNTSTAWKDIYGQRKCHQKFIKSDFYDGGKFASEAPSIITERDPEKHAVWRRQLGTAFSDRAMRDVEHIVVDAVDKLVDKLGQSCGDARGVDIDSCFNMVTFDIMGHMSLRHDFSCVQKGELHPWAIFLGASLRMMSVNDTLQKFPTLGKIACWLFAKPINKMLADRGKHEKYTQDLIKEYGTRRRRRTLRLTEASQAAQAAPRRGVVVRLCLPRHRGPAAGHIRVSEMQIAAIASDLVIAGTETSATGLSAIFYYLLKNPPVLAELRAELHAAFDDASEITPSALARLKYLEAVIMEGLRLYPPLPIALFRLVPPGGDTVDGHFLPGGTVVSVHPLAANMLSRNFSDPWTFKPARWLDPGCTDDREVCRPFSLGPRGCIGLNLAWMLRTVVGKLFFKYDFTLIDKDLDWHKASRMHTLWESPALRVRVEPCRHSSNHEGTVDT